MFIIYMIRENNLKAERTVRSVINHKLHKPTMILVTWPRKYFSGREDRYKAPTRRSEESEKNTDSRTRPIQYQKEEAENRE